MGHAGFSTHVRRVSLGCVFCLTVVIGGLAAPTRAAAQQQIGDDLDTDRTVSASMDPGQFLPGVVAAQAGAALVAGSGWAGYDGATRVPLMGGTAEARLSRWFVLGVSLVYASGNDLQPAALRPSVLARAQILQQGRHGIDGGLAFAYRQDRFVGEDGFFQGTATVERHGEAGMLLANLSYGTDGEGDDREGELRLVAMGRAAARIHIGLDGRVRRSLASTDPHRGEHGTPSFELTAGPAATYTIGPIALMVETGFSGAELVRFQTGLLAFGGLGAVF